MSRGKKLTPDQLAQVERMSTIRLPQETMAMILGIPFDTFTKMLRRDKELRGILDRGRGRGTEVAYTTAFQLANGYKRQKNTYNAIGVKVSTEYEDVPPDPNMLRFWLKTQEKWRETDRLELTGADGAPLAVTQVTREVREKEIERLLGQREKLAIVAEIEEKAAAAAKDVTPPDDDAEV